MTSIRAISYNLGECRWCCNELWPDEKNVTLPTSTPFTRLWVVAPNGFSSQSRMAAGIQVLR